MLRTLEPDDCDPFVPGGRRVAEVSDSEPRHGTEDPRLGTYIEEIV